MDANEIQIAVIHNAIKKGFEIEETARIFEAYEAAYQYLTMEVPDEEKEKVEGELTNHCQHLYARSKDGTEYEVDGEIIGRGTEDGDIIGDFADKSGNIVLVIFKK